MKVNGLPRQGEEEATMSDEYLIKNTTREKRERIVNEALGVTDGRAMRRMRSGNPQDV